MTRKKICVKKGAAVIYPEEKETVLNFNERDQTAEIYTYNLKLKNRLARLCKEMPEQVTFQYESEGGVAYELPKGWIKINPPKKVHFSK